MSMVGSSIEDVIFRTEHIAGHKLEVVRVIQLYHPHSTNTRPSTQVTTYRVKGYNGTDTRNTLEEVLVWLQEELGE